MLWLITIELTNSNWRYRVRDHGPSAPLKVELGRFFCRALTLPASREADTKEDKDWLSGSCDA